jgi:hypothetical protein
MSTCTMTPNGAKGVYVSRHISHHCLIKPLSLFNMDLRWLYNGLNFTLYLDNYGDLEIWVEFVLLNNHFLKTGLLRYNSASTQFTHLKYTTQGF